MTVKVCAALLLNCAVSPQCHPPTDAPSKNAFKKFEAAFTEQYAAHLESFSEEDYRKYEKLEGLFKFLDEIIPDDESMLDGEEHEPRTRGQKRCATSQDTHQFLIQTLFLYRRARSSAASSAGVDDEDISGRTRSKRPR